MAVNLRAPFILSQALAPAMIAQRRGKIVNISSQTGVIALDDHAAYASSKGGLNALTKSLCAEWARHNVQVNAICPTVVLTPMGIQVWSPPEKSGPYDRGTPLRRFGEAVEIADAALYLASPACGTGERGDPDDRGRVSECLRCWMRKSAFARYEAVRPRLPVATFPAMSHHVNSLAEVADRYDAFVLDAFGVLNVGDTPIPGAVGRMADLRAMGKRLLIVLTNAASYPRATALAKYHRLGFDFTSDEVVSTRDVAVAPLTLQSHGRPSAQAMTASPTSRPVSRT